MKIAFAGKGGAGKTTLTAWVGDYLARQGHHVWLIDADTALSLGVASGLQPEDVPVPLIQRQDIILERIGQGIISLTPEVSDLPEQLAVPLPLLSETQKPGGSKKLLVMGSIAGAGGGCACEANALLKALLAHLVLQPDTYLLVDLEAGVEHLGRGTVAAVDALIAVTEPSLRSLKVASDVCALAQELGLHKQVLAMNRAENGTTWPPQPHLPSEVVFFPHLPSLGKRMLSSGSVLALEEQALVDDIIKRTLEQLSNYK